MASDALLLQQTNLMGKQNSEAVDNEKIDKKMGYSKLTMEALHLLCDARRVKQHNKKTKADVVKSLCEADHKKFVWANVGDYSSRIFNVHNIFGNAIMQVKKIVEAEDSAKIQEALSTLNNLLEGRYNKLRGLAQLLEANNNVLRENSENITPPYPPIAGWQSELQNKTRLQTSQMCKRFVDHGCKERQLAAKNEKLSGSRPFEKIFSGLSLEDSSAITTSDFAIQTSDNGVLSPSEEMATTGPEEGPAVATPTSAPSKVLPAKDSANEVTKATEYADEKMDSHTQSVMAHAIMSKHARKFKKGKPKNSETASNSNAGKHHSSSMSNSANLSIDNTVMPGNRPAQHITSQSSQNPPKRAASRPPAPSAPFGSSTHKKARIGDILN